MDIRCTYHKRPVKELFETLTTRKRCSLSWEQPVKWKACGQSD